MREAMMPMESSDQEKEHYKETSKESHVNRLLAREKIIELLAGKTDHDLKWSIQQGKLKPFNRFEVSDATYWATKRHNPDDVKKIERAEADVVQAEYDLRKQVEETNPEKLEELDELLREWQIARRQHEASSELEKGEEN